MSVVHYLMHSNSQLLNLSFVLSMKSMTGIGHSNVLVCNESTDGIPLHCDLMALMGLMIEGGVLWVTVSGDSSAVYFIAQPSLWSRYNSE